MLAVHTVADLIALWQSAAHCAVDVGVNPHQPRDWAIRGRIPPEHWEAFTAAARRRGLPVDFDLLARIHAARRKASTKAEHEAA